MPVVKEPSLYHVDKRVNGSTNGYHPFIDCNGRTGALRNMCSFLFFLATGAVSGCSLLLPSQSEVVVHRWDIGQCDAEHYYVVFEYEFTTSNAGVLWFWEDGLGRPLKLISGCSSSGGSASKTGGLIYILPNELKTVLLVPHGEVKHLSPGEKQIICEVKPVETQEAAEKLRLVFMCVTLDQYEREDSMRQAVVPNVVNLGRFTFCQYRWYEGDLITRKSPLSLTYTDSSFEAM